MKGQVCLFTKAKLFTNILKWKSKKGLKMHAIRTTLDSVQAHLS